MPSPFPGMDPYLENPAWWQDFHVELMSGTRALLNRLLPVGYSARAEGWLRLIELDPPAAPRQVSADAGVTRGGDPTPARASAGAAAATLEPVAVALPALEEVRDRWVEILHLPERRLVAVVEVLSPRNKAGDGRGEYLAKRRALLRQDVHLIELDLLLAGARLPMRGPLPPGDYYALVSRANRRPSSDVYAWPLRATLPTVPVPLLAPEPDVPLDLAEVFATACERGAYDREVDYARPPVAPLRGEDVGWAAQTARRLTPHHS